jgi:hypothetical protein
MNRELGEIEAYYARIGYFGPREPALAVLQSIVAGHTAAIPFENLDVLAKRPIRLDGIVNLADPGRLLRPRSLRVGNTIGEQRTFRPEPPRHRHNEHTTAV